MRDQSFKRNRSERGAAILLFTVVTVLVVLPLVGLAIDGGIAYFAHERLVAAADAAALAGARSLNIGQDFASQKANAESVAKQFFYINFPPGLLNSSNVTIDALAQETGTHTRTVQVQMSADIQLYFLPLIKSGQGESIATVRATAQTSRRDVNVVLTLDRSGSMSGVCVALKNDAENFVSLFTNGRDKLGLITFMGNANVDYPSNLQFKPDLTSTLSKLNCGGNTGSAAALSLAHQQILNAAEPGALNVVVFFTDGVPNGFTAGKAADDLPPGFPLKSGKSCNNSTTVPGYIAEGGGIYDAQVTQSISSTNTPYVSGCPSGSHSALAQSYTFIPETDFYGNSASGSGYAPVARNSQNQITFSAANSDAVSLNAADDAARKIRQDGIFIYVIGLGSNGGVDNNFLSRVANDPSSAGYNASQPAGKYYFSPNAGQLGAAFNSIASEILRISR